MTVAELFDRCMEMTAAEPSAAALRYMHQTLVLCCSEALRDSRQAYGNLFSQVDYLSKRHRMPMAARMAIQQARRHSNGREVGSRDEWLYDVRALAVFAATVFATPMPPALMSRLPLRERPLADTAAVNRHYVRCIVEGWDEDHVFATTADGPISIAMNDCLPAELLAEGQQLNLLDCRQKGTAVEASIIVLEPDFLVDISSVAACFQDYGHHPLSYLLNRLKPRANSQAILLGNFAGTLLDDLTHRSGAPFADSLFASFREQALQFAACPDFDAARFKADAQRQAVHIGEAVDVLFGSDDGRAAPEGGYDRRRAILEPSFVCEHLGLQGRVDLMTDDLRLLVEQKSGRNWNIECPLPGQKGQQREDHYVQLLLYYGVLRYNFKLPADRVDIRLLYSRYPARQGLLVVNYYHQLFRQAILQRNRIVAQEIGIARSGFASLLPRLDVSLLLEDSRRADFFRRYILPEANAVVQPLLQLSDTERDYAERMFTFVYREQLAQKVGVGEERGGAAADLWSMPLAEKIDTGGILLLRTDRSPLDAAGTDATLLRFARQTDATMDGGMPNFRRGDMVYLYRYEDQPDVRTAILYKGVVDGLDAQSVAIRLNEPQHNPQAFPPGTYAVEHASSDVTTTSALRSIHAFCTASSDRRRLLLGQRAPRRDASLQLSRSYSPHYDDILLRAKQARDYFLLQGPPGTGKTSQALRFLVEEELLSPPANHISHLSPLASHLLLTAYTNRAVDEICAMLDEASLDYLRIGSEASCDVRFASRLLERRLGQKPRLGDLKRMIGEARIVVCTTSMLQARPFLLELKHFSLCIVDEASQILEPSIIGVLASERIDRFILIGDHKQLPAVVQQPDDDPRLHDCRLSLFERLLRQERDAGRTDFCGILRLQGRMHPDIARFPNEMFYARERLECVPLPHQQEDSLGYVQPSADTLDEQLKHHRVLFLPVSPEPAGIASSDKVSAAEARLVADLLRRIYRQVGAVRFDAARTVGVIVPYRNQIAMIRQEIERLRLPALSDISIDTVERYQGSQRDVIIYSFTVSKPYQLDFLTANCFEERDDANPSQSHIIDRKLNVAMTRARRQLLMTGRADILRQNAIFARLIEEYSIKQLEKYGK